MNTYHIIFDDQCQLCLRFKQGLEYFSNNRVQITFYPLNCSETFELFPMLNPSACRDEVHMIDAFGKIWIGSEVVAELVKILPVVSKLAWLLEKDIGQRTTDYFYQKINEFRKKCTSC